MPDGAKKESEEGRISSRGQHSRLSMLAPSLGTLQAALEPLADHKLEGSPYSGTAPHTSGIRRHIAKSTNNVAQGIKLGLDYW